MPPPTPAPTPAPTPRPTDTRITILLCTRNGAAHLPAQLASYAAQDHAGWDLWVSDDGSTDDTRALVTAFGQARAGRNTVRLIAGPQQGLAANYITALCHPDFPAGPVALSDQDDVWHPEKLRRALDGLAPHAGAALYGAQYTYADADLHPAGTSTAPGLPPGFGNALVQNIVSGHTATLNPAALALVRRAGVPTGVPYHDWWLYQLITGAGGQVVIDDHAVLLYRQHGDNAMGAHRGARATWIRLRQLVDGTYGGWMAANRRALRDRAATLLTPAARATLDLVDSAPTRGPARMRRLARAGLRRGGRVGQMALMLAALLGRA